MGGKWLARVSRRSEGTMGGLESRSCKVYFACRGIRRRAMFCKKSAKRRHVV